MLKQFVKLRNIQLFSENRNIALNHIAVYQKRYLQTSLEEKRDSEKDNESKNEFSRLGIKSRNPFAGDPKDYIQEVKKEKVPAFSSEDREKRLKVLQLEADIAHQEGRRVPKLDFFKDEHWEHILTLPSQSARRKYYAYLWQIAMKRESQAQKKEEKAAEALIRREALRKEREENDHIIYGLGHCSMFLRIYDSTIDSWLNYKLIRAMQFAPKIVLDCSYDNHMNRKEAVNAAKQLTLCFAENRAHDDPFDMHYCNVNWDSLTMQALKKTIPTIQNPEFPLNVHEKSFTEIFPKENIVYLTPHCRNDLESFNHDDVYVIGAMVDQVNNEPLSLAKAKKLGLRMARLPLDKYMQWNAGSGKSLTLNQMVKILLDLKSTGDWETALKHVPRRKVGDMEQQSERERKSLDRRASKLNIHIKDILKRPRGNNVTSFARPDKVRTRKEGMEFDLSTWGSKNKNK